MNSRNKDVRTLAEEIESCQKTLIALGDENRQYKNKPLEADAVSALQAEIKDCNMESGLHIQLIINEPKAFDGFCG